MKSNGGVIMRTVTKEQIQSMKNSSNVFSLILNTPKPDFTELNRLSKQFEDSMKKTREEDLQKISMAVQGK